MPTPSGPRETPSSPARPLVERVRERVSTAAATLAADGRAETQSTTPTRPSGVESAPDVRALRRVFHDMGRNQRSARHQTGQPPSPVVRKAARAFRRAPTLSGLVLVAASLEEVGLLSW